MLRKNSQHGNMIIAVFEELKLYYTNKYTVSSLCPHRSTSEDSNNQKQNKTNLDR